MDNIAVERQTVCCTKRLLVVENDPAWRGDHVKNLTEWGYDVYVAQGFGAELLDDARRQAANHRCHLALVDLRLLDDDDRNDTSGLRLVSEIKPTASIIFSGYGDRPTVVDALKRRDAWDFVGKEEGPRRLQQALVDVLSDAFRSGTTIQWHEQHTPADILHKLGLYDAAIPSEEPEEVLNNLYPIEKAAKVALKPVTEYYRSPGNTTPFERSEVFIASTLGADGRWHKEEIVKLAPRQKIQDEIDNYRSYVEHYLPHHRAARIEDSKHSVILWDLGAIRYTNIAIENRQPLRQWYAKSQPEAVIAAFDDLFRKTLGMWYNEPSPKQSGCMFDYYEKTIPKLGPRLSSYPETPGKLTFPDIAPRLRNPVLWASKHREQSSFVSRWNTYTHGDLHSDNIFVDGFAQTCVIDYESSGPGHFLRDIVELEADIRLRLLPLVASDLRYAFALDLLLLAQERPEQPPAWSRICAADPEMEFELRKAFDIIAALRQLAHQVTHFEQMDEYYWALLMETLISVVRNYPDWKDQEAAALARERALLSAALLCERLARWNKTWPPPEWAPAQAAPRPSEPYADTYSVYEKGLTRLLQRLPLEHPRYPEALTYQQRLGENSTSARRYGDTEMLKADRAQVVARLNELALATVGVTFSELCG
jgi:ActR/RegA family two-component response regulator